ncbi:methyl-accepting chemotaxis protein [Dyella ginsengisoli]|uniref:methyl-accepting chemotaxis protein n=1 Tax=Dyella ginsengisoli TaxID=363848 RepID=UPI00035FBE02
MKFKTRIMMFPMIAIGVFAAGWAVNQAVATHAMHDVSSLHETDYPALEALKELDTLVQATTQTVQSAAAEGDAARLDDVAGIAARFGAKAKVLAALEGHDRQSAEIEQKYAAYVTAARAAATAMLSGKAADMSANIASMQASQKAVEDLIGGGLKQARNAVDARISGASVGLDRTRMVNSGLGLVIMLVLGAGAWMSLRNVRRELGADPEQLRVVVEKLSAGNFSEDGSHADAAESSVLGRLRVMQGELKRIVSSIRTVADEVETTAAQIADGNDDLSRRTQNQAASLEETASSMEEMTSTVHQSAANATQADQLARGARSTAEQGQQVVGEVIDAMQEIDASSKRIADIVTLIDEIAFQTNLLALNAAVEAARAGEQGRGFAVVAAEVRNLAQRSANAAKDIKGLIQDSAAKVASGSALVQRSGEALKQIVSGVQRVSDIVAEIAASNQEQASGINQVNNAISSIDEDTQQNAAMVEQASAASRGMRERAQFLLREVAFFQLDEGDAPASAAVETTQPEAPRVPMREVTRPVPAPASVAATGEAAWQEF